MATVCSSERWDNSGNLPDSPAGKGGLLTALRRLGDNPIALREWRGLLHQCRDWRLWLGLRLPKDARGWGVPAVAWFAVAPFLLWGMVKLLQKAIPSLNFQASSPGDPSLDLLSLTLLALALYSACSAVGLMAPAVVRERERETWEQLRTAALSRDEILVGLLAGRLAPVLAMLLVAGGTWVALRPVYAPLLQAMTPFRMTSVQITTLVGMSMAFVLASGTLSLAASTWSRRTGTAVLAATFGLLFTAAITTLLELQSPPVWEPVLEVACCALLTVVGYWAARVGLRH